MISVLYELYIYFIIFIFGTVIGSFLDVVAVILYLRKIRADAQ